MKRPPGRPKGSTIITDKDREKIEQMAALGLRTPDIACVIGCSDDTIERNARKELNSGRARGNAILAKTAWAMATSGEDAVMTRFLCKVRLHWRESDDQPSVIVDDGEKKITIKVSIDGD